MAKADIWMPLFIGDYLADTTRLTTEQHGAYFLLIMDYWRNGKPPEDDAILANITRMQIKDWKRIKPVVIGFFNLENGHYSHSRIDRELKDATASKEKAEAKAKKAAEKRWAQEAAKHEEKDQSSNAPSNAPSITSGNAQEVQEQCPLPLPLPLTTKTKSKDSALATRLPADWSPSDLDMQFCKTERPDLNASVVADRFRDYWVAVPGVKGRKVDWQATWRNWVRNEKLIAQIVKSSRHSGFEQINYREGVAADGSF